MRSSRRAPSARLRASATRYGALLRMRAASLREHPGIPPGPLRLLGDLRHQRETFRALRAERIARLLRLFDAGKRHLEGSHAPLALVDRPPFARQHPKQRRVIAL